MRGKNALVISFGLAVVGTSSSEAVWLFMSVFFVVVGMKSTAAKKKKSIYLF